MRRLQPVIWAKGTVLTPQHLQAQDRFIENTLQFRLEALNFKPWGFTELRLDRESLSTGQLAISRAAGLFPDGLAFEIPDSDAAPPPKPLAHFLEDHQSSTAVYLAIPSYRERGLNVSVATQNTDTRYVAEALRFRDEAASQSEKLIQVARRNFRLLVEGEVRQGTAALKLAVVSRNPTGAFQLEPGFVPPLLDLASSDYLTGIARRLVEILSSRSTMLAGMRRQKNQSLADFTSADIANFWLLYTINSHLPLVRHLFECRHGHPEGLFSVMLSLAGALTTFSLQVHPRDLPAYDHEDLGACFRILDEKLRLLLETVVPTNFVSLPLKLARPSIYATTVDEDKLLFNTRMYLAVSAEMNEAELIARTPQLVKVCSANHIEHLIKHALPGIQLLHVPSPPSSIPVKLKYQYFALNQSGMAWESVGRARNLAAYVPGDLPNPQLELIILLPQAA
jgi:type VI secretion system protein ImpJ